MANYAVVENDKVINVCIASEEDKKPNNWILASESVAIDWDYVNGQFVDNRPISEVVATPAPTKEELLAQLQALTTQINALA